MRSKPLFFVLCSAGLLAIVAPGCAISDLQNTNRRLKEANDRLVSENNRLEQELAASEKEVAEKAKLIDQLQNSEEARPAPAAAPALKETTQRASPFKPDRATGFDAEEGIETHVTPQGILLRLEDRVFFPQGRATLSPKGKTILNRLARTLNSRYKPNLIRVEGHTDDVPVKKVRNQYPTNWELSTARACTVVRYLVDSASLNPRRIYPAGFAYFKPVSAAHSESARQKNRRVEILILNERA
jgi:chemotaxis protein MotB